MNLLSGRLVDLGGRPGVEIAGRRVALGGAWSQLIGAHGDRDVIVGVRPEDLYETATGAAGDRDACRCAWSRSSRWAPRPCC